MTEKELTWVATVFDCEGCLDRWIKQHTKKNGKTVEYNYPRIQIVNTSQEMIIRLKELTSMGKIYGPYKSKGKDSYKLKWLWMIRRKDVARFLALIWGEWISEYRRETARELGVAPDDLNELEKLIESRIQATKI